MQLSSIPQLYRNVQRWREILAVLQRYGLADWLSQHQFDLEKLPFGFRLTDRQGVSLDNYSRETRIRLALTELGPTFIKLGQILSTRPDLVGPVLADELKGLQASVPPDPPERFRQTVRDELPALASGEEDGLEIEDQPLAAASIGQVHRATLSDGRKVVVKVQRAGIEQTVHRDLDVLVGLAQLAQRVPTLAVWRPLELVRQITPMLLRELDFDRERQHLHLFRRLLAGHRQVVVPAPIDQYSSRRVLTMERLEGIPVNQLANEGIELARRQQLARILAETYSAMVFRYGVFHADPHPGNLLLLTDDRLGIVDFGMVGRIDDRLREMIGDMLVAINAGDGALLTRLVKRVGKAPPELDEAALSIDVAEFLDNYASQSLERFNLAGALNDFTNILHRHRIELPGQSALLLKMLMSLEGALSTLRAPFNTLDVLRPQLRQAGHSRLGPRRQVRQLRRVYLELERLLEVMPDQVIGLLDQLRQGRAGIRLEHQRLGPAVNRLVSGLITSALFLGSALMLSMKVPPLLFSERHWFGLQDLSVFGIVGLVVSVGLMLRLVRAIGRSGHLDRE
jgi:ubiquinone biosynthesis protein